MNLAEDVIDKKEVTRSTCLLVETIGLYHGKFLTFILSITHQHWYKLAGDSAAVDEKIWFDICITGGTGWRQGMEDRI